MRRVASIVINISGIADPLEFIAEISKPRGALLRFKKQIQRPFTISQLEISPTEISGSTLHSIFRSQFHACPVCGRRPVHSLVKMVCLQRGPPQIQGCACFQQPVMVSLRKGVRLQKELLRNCELPLFSGQDAPRPEEIAACGIVNALAVLFGLRKFPVRGRELLLVCEDYALNGQLPDDSFRVAGSGERSQEAQGIVIHSAPHHGFCF